MPERLCTLDCNGCHVTPTGGGLRTPAGEYYGKQVISTWGARPGDAADPAKYRPQGHPKQGRYRLGEGFSGWWPGPTPMREIADRFGPIDADPAFSWGVDYRGASLTPLEDGDRDSLFFPMQADLHLSARAYEHVVAYASAGLKGNKKRNPDNPLDSFDEMFAVNELFLKVDRLRNNSYVRVGRFAPPYGWRVPDHTSFVQRNLGFGEKRRVWGVEAGWNPNYPLVQGALFMQGLNDFPGHDVAEGVGASVLGGVRELGWQLLGNLHVFKGDPPAVDGDDTSPIVVAAALADPDAGAERTDITAGVSWGLNLYPVVLLEEVDFRRRTVGDDSENGLFSMSEVNWLFAGGLTALVKHDWMLPDTGAGDQTHRLAAGLQWDVYNHVQALWQLRTTHPDVGPSEQEIFSTFHLWW